jgi:hypothetical protein
MQNFHEEVQIKNFSGEEKKQIPEAFVSFYRFLEQLFDNKNFFKQSLLEINDKLLEDLRKENTLVLYLNDKSSTPLHYFTKKERRINIIDGVGVRNTTLF